MGNRQNKFIRHLLRAVIATFKLGDASVGL
jgi:hypothetical protein